MSEFRLVSEFRPTGDQPQAIEALCGNLSAGVRDQVLLGVTGSGKTFTMAQVVARLGRPALVLAPNKTLAAQLYNEFKTFFPHNAVEYFVSYYDYYQPEAYLPHTDTFIEKDSSINDDIDKLRHAATHALLTRRDVLIVASVSCIYGLGSPEYYAKMIIPVEEGQALSMESLLARLVEVHYERNDYDFHRGTFRVRGDAVEIIPAYARERALRLTFFGDEIESILETDPLTGAVTARLKKTVIYPGSHYVSDRDNLNRAMDAIREELRGRLETFRRENRLVEAQRLEQRTQFDLETIEELGYCNGIENYSRHLDGRSQGQPPATLLDYFPKDFILFVDESHITIPQVGGMYNGDISRKTTLVDFGFRLPSALDNRPLNFDEFLTRVGQSVYVSATPGPWEMERAQGLVVEQIIRPTGLVDPEVEMRPTEGQMDDILAECRKRQARDERVLITTLTKRMAEDLTDYLNDMGVTARYLHSDIDTLERMAIIQALRAGEFQVLVGINLLREGLDLPEVTLVAILDADKEGFLRSTRSLIQTFGRAARNVEGRVLLYADAETQSMRAALEETARRRRRQLEYNEKHGITPKTVRKRLENALADITTRAAVSDGTDLAAVAEDLARYGVEPKGLEKEVRRLEREMRAAAKELEFERAAVLRDKIGMLKERLLQLG
ncbi:excinuclease ABC subunit UvrB [Desulfovibrio aminophilus]|uniref:excinuclease ABC subunit UvrB n=1 Tax=Desulfovibrio aminophilus TaxID=81425 RepID=UPI0003FF2CD2|nr:excinuclease ABC subunit UvrB [Desulfovibrio aminophilus]